MATQVQLRRGTSTQNDSFTGAQGELTFDTTNKRVRIHDGATAGGFELKTENAGGDTLFADGEKAIFGAGSDLQIYHDGNDSKIIENGSGDLYIGGASNMRFVNSAVNATYAMFTEGGKVQLNYNDSKRFETTDLGIDVTGTVTMTGNLSFGDVGESISSPSVGILAIQSRGPVQIWSDTNNNGAATSSVFEILRDSTYSGATGKQTLTAYDNGDISFYEATGTTPKFFWDASAERLGIGTSSPSSTLHLKDTRATLRLESESIGGTTFDIRNGVSGGGEGGISFRDITNSATRMVIDSSGNVGIGLSNPSANLHVSSSGDTIARITSADGNGAFLDLGDASDPDGGRIVYDSGSNLGFSTASTERMRIDSSGNLLVGGTSAYGTSTFTVGYDGDIKASSPSRSAIFNATTSAYNGSLVDFRVADAAVGTIGAYYGDMKIGTGDTGLVFGDGQDAIYPATTLTASSRDAAIDLGLASGARFKDLYLSGGVYLGGTGSANKLDDYEEGSFTPVYGGSTGIGTSTVGSISGLYTKIGNSVTVWIRVANMTVSGATGAINITGLPFASSHGSSGDYATTEVNMTHNITFNTSRNQCVYVINNTLYGLESISGTTWTDWAVTNASGIYMNITMTYRTS